MRRAGQPGEVAALARWLSCDEASYIPGARIAIDGGLSLKQARGACKKTRPRANQAELAARTGGFG